jgi:hypothetical protein
MSALTMGTVVKGPGATKDYFVDFSPYLKPTEKVTAAVYVASGVGLTIGSGAYASTIAADGKSGYVWLAAGTAGTTYTVTVTFTTDNVPPRIEQDTFDVTIEGAAVGGNGAELGQILSFDGNTYVPRRFWVIPSLDPSGSAASEAANTAAIRAAITAAAASRAGAHVYIPEGTYAVGDGANDIFSIPKGLTIGGPERGLMRSSRLFGASDLAQTGARLDVRGTGKLFTMSYQTAVRDFEIYYPNQNTNSAPAVYGAAFSATSNCHIPTIERITAVNPYDLIDLPSSNGGLIRDIWAFPLHRGVYLGRCADVVRVQNVHFNYNVSPNAGDFGANLLDYVTQNASGFVVDGAEQFDFTDCFVLPYFNGLLIQDIDGDGFKASYGTWKGGGFDNCVNCIWVKGNTPAIGAHGLKVYGASFAPQPGAVPASDPGVGVRMDDTAVPASSYYRPSVYLTDCTMGGGTQFGRCLWAAAGSYGVVLAKGGFYNNFTEYGARVSGANSLLHFAGVSRPTVLLGGAVWLSGGAGASETDTILT